MGLLIKVAEKIFGKYHISDGNIVKKRTIQRAVMGKKEFGYPGTSYLWDARKETNAADRGTMYAGQVAEIAARGGQQFDKKRDRLFL